MARSIWSGGWPSAWGVFVGTHLTMTHGLFPNGVLPDVWVGFLGAAWSLSTEWQFYVLALLVGKRLGLVRMAWLFVIMAGVACSGVGVLIGFVIPRFASVLADLGGDTPVRSGVFF